VKLSEIHVGEQYDIGDCWNPRMCTVVGIEVFGSRLRVRVRMERGDEFLLPPQRVRRPWAEAQAELDARKRVAELARELTELARELTELGLPSFPSAVGGQRVMVGSLTHDEARALIARLHAIEDLLRAADGMEGA
jgi:hypothetical protein